ncbi:M91 family zinc metallopeptidase [Luteimonas sp. RD2P54]|uniref:M91 family zinc metallopeptidase n=1 Tax=Luteimonas endophytica TaxID=3042023 RepID=A0ABT6JD63_9GAMM|nr:M91 family zinc metallopeptidase [Luteimonas endophytica]MDH5824754.1 M91 family zinc metallopeptidase [Luteimonas endophytica]
MSLDSATSPTASQPAQTYWDNAAHNEERFAEAPLASDRIDAVDSRDSATDGAVTINGSDAGSRLADRQTPDGKTIRNAELHQGEQATVTREQTIAPAGFGQTYVSSDQVVFTTGEGDDNVQISQRDDGTLDIDVNGEVYEVRLTEQQELTLRTGGGNDVIEAAANVSVNMVVEGGDGDDRVVSGNGDDRIDGGTGADTVESLGGRNDIFGGAGNDTIQGGSGINVVYGGDGDDVLRGGGQDGYLEGGAGNDEIHAGAGDDIISGGLGDDVIHSGTGNNAIYAGQGSDTVQGARSDDTVYAQASDLINAATGATPTVVNVVIDADVGNRGITVTGSDAFRQRVEADMEFLRSSPNGQRMLAEFDAAAEAKGNTVTIKELANEQNGYAQTFSRDADIVNGRPGAGGDVDISYNPSFHMDAFPAPVVVLYHEMSHAYNGVNGTFQPGTYQGEGPDSGRVPNAERQAVGLETSATPYDFDGDPATPATTHNPIELTENGLRRELGLPDRPSYAL